MARYQVYNSENKIIVVSRFAGKAVRGIAKCSPGDSFDAVFGNKLATARCDAKIAEKRVVRAATLLEEALAQRDAAEARVAKMQQYLLDAGTEMQEAENRVRELETEAGVTAK